MFSAFVPLYFETCFSFSRNLVTSIWLKHLLKYLLFCLLYSVGTWQRHERVKWSKNCSSLVKIRKRIKAIKLQKWNFCQMNFPCGNNLHSNVYKKDLTQM